ncbi:MAG: hypothetical protein AB7F65_00605 [Dehalococcoidia bacterium]
MDLALSSARRFELAATLVGGITLGLLSLFLVGEVFGGDLSGVVHLVQLVPLAALLALGWRSPNLAGVLLLAIGGALALAYFVETADSDTVSAVERALVAGLFLVPPIAAGVLFLVAARRPRGATVR